MCLFSFFCHESRHVKKKVVTAGYKILLMIGQNQLLPFIKSKDVNNIFAPMDYTFYLKNEPDKRGRKPVYININVGGRRKRIPAAVKIEEKYWDSKNMRIIDTAESRDQHLLLKQIDAKITSIRMKHRLSEVPLTLQSFLDQLKTAPSTVDFGQFYKSIRDIQPMKPNTLAKHDSVFEKLKDFRALVAFQDINYKFFDEFRSHLKIKFKNAQSTINSNIAVLKKYLSLAEKYGIKLGFDLDDIQVGDTGGRIIWLDEKEISKLHEYYFSSFIPDNYKLSLGYFLIACYTGLRISDVKARKREEMLEEFLRVVSFKGGKDLTLYLIPKVHDIINSNPDLFLTLWTEVTMNKHLKKISNTCGIRKRLYFHVGRHSFATNYLIKGGQIENLQTILGHTKIMTTMKYVHVAKDTAARSMMLMQ